MSKDTRQKAIFRNIAVCILVPTLAIYVMVVVGVLISKSFFGIVLDFLYFDLLDFSNRIPSVGFVLVFGFLGVLIGWLLLIRKNNELDEGKLILGKSFLIGIACGIVAVILLEILKTLMYITVL